jgi:membrane-bound lytic murein transglycosylase MltF
LREVADHACVILERGQHGNGVNGVAITVSQRLAGCRRALVNCAQKQRGRQQRRRPHVTPERPSMKILPAAAALTLLLFTISSDAAEPANKQRALPTQAKEWKGDFDGMVKRRMIRVLVPYSRSLYYNDKGRERGITADFVRDFEQYINRKFAKELGKRPITVYIVPTTRDLLLKHLVEGKGDIAAGNLTVTPERLKTVDFFVPADQRDMAEVVLSGPKSAPVAGANDLSGKTVHVRKASSYYESLLALNQQLKKDRKAEVKLVFVPDALEDEDMMEMLNADVLDYIVVDDWKAKMWAQILPNVKLNESAVLRADGKTGWAHRKGSPKLDEILGEYYTNVVKKQNLWAQRLAQYNRRVKVMTDPTASAERKRFDDMIAIFRKYGEKYDFDPLMLAAQGYQESQLNQQAKSHVGAIGIMQVMPATGAELKVGDIQIAENNIHAGTKYMDILMERYFQDAHFSEANRSLFAFAAYNAGPGNISRMRKEAEKRGLDHDKWFDNVEIVTAEKIGMETTTYVRNIFKYYVAYRLMLDMHEAQQKAREQVK